MAELFGVRIPAISKHLKNIFDEGELEEQVVISKMETTSRYGAIANKTQTSETNFYNLDAIISVGYRLKIFSFISIINCCRLRFFIDNSLKTVFFCAVVILYQTIKIMTSAKIKSCYKNNFFYSNVVIPNLFF